MNLDKQGICELSECGSQFERKRKEQRFCSRSCGRKFNHPKLVRQCKDDECNNLFKVDFSGVKLFCSRSCSAKFNNHNGNKRNCPGCGEVLKRRHQKKYCSPGCGSAHRSKHKIESWLRGDWDGTVLSGLSDAIAKHLKREAGWRCQNKDCCVPGGWSVINPASGKVPVQVDHIDGNCMNNSKENLIVLCPNCHSLTPTYMALNKGSGRTYRAKYGRVKMAL